MAQYTFQILMQTEHVDLPVTYTHMIGTTDLVSRLRMPIEIETN